MSTTATKRPLAEAIAEAHAFRDLFPPKTYERWEFAGSVRRERPEACDIEHVVIPKFGMATARGMLFGDPVSNLLFDRLNRLVEHGRVRKHIYSDDRTRWGDRYRGVSIPFVDGGGQLHEIWTADPNNWGSILAIRTGPADLSQRAVSAMLSRGLRHHQGRAWRCAGCECDVRDRDRCKRCDGTGLKKLHPIPTPDEQTFFQLAGMPFVEPEGRG